jgi:two-component system chemotaxis response regulator CheY
MKNFRALVVDDFEVIRRFHISNLKKCGIQHIDEANNGSEAVNMANQTSYDIIILDWHMPELDGYETIKILRNNGFTQPILMCTDENDSLKIAMAQKIGASWIVQKPYTPTQFRSMVKHYLNIKEG